MIAHLAGRLTGIVFFLACFATTGSAQGRFFMPVELGHGFISDSRETELYTASLRVHPSLAFGERRLLRVGPIAALTYFNPDWETLGGGRVSYRVLTFGPLEEVGIDVAFESQWGTDGSNPVGVAAGVDLDGLFRIGLNVARELDRDETLVAMTVGSDPLALVPLLAGKKIVEDDGDVEPEPEERRDYYGVVSLRAEVEALADFEADSALGTRAREFLGETHEQVADLESLRNLLMARDLAPLADRISSVLDIAERLARNESIEVPAVRDEPKLVAALLKGWRDALEE